MVQSIPDDYKGLCAIDHIRGQARKKAYQCNWKQLEANYGDNVEFQLLKEQVLLCPHTEPILYERPSKKKASYRAGSRPELEKTVAKVTKDAMDDRQKVLALMRFCRDLYRKTNGVQLFYGGTEEELIKKGEQLCECLGRLFVALCEIAKIEARIVMHVIGGHIVAEAFFENRWAYIDPRCGLYYLDADSNFLSVRDLIRAPELMKEQPQMVKNDCSSRWTWEQRLQNNLEKFFHTSEIQVYKMYSLAKCDRYHYGWKTDEDLARAGMNRAAYEYHSISATILGQPQPKQPQAVWCNGAEKTVSDVATFVLSVEGYCIPPMRVWFELNGQIHYPSGGNHPVGNLHQGTFFYMLRWDSIKVKNGEYELTAYVDDAATDRVSTSVTVNVDN